MENLCVKIAVLLLSTYAKFADAMSSVGGWILAAILFVVNFYSGYKVVVFGIIGVVLFDAVWGIAAARYRGKYFSSDRARDSLLKLAVYATFITMMIIIDKIASLSGIEIKLTTAIVGVIIGMAEIWSTCGSILIICPNMPIIRMLRKALTGEIAHKLDISEEDVEKYLTRNQNGKE